MELVNSFVQLPVETQLAVAGLVGLLVTIAFNYLGKLAPWSVPFLSKWKEELSAGLSGLATGWLSAHLPGGDFENVSVLGVNFAVALIVALLSYGARSLYYSVRIKGAR